MPPAQSQPRMRLQVVAKILRRRLGRIKTTQAGGALCAAVAGKMVAAIAGRPAAVHRFWTEETALAIAPRLSPGEPARDLHACPLAQVRRSGATAQAPGSSRPPGALAG